MGINLKKGQKIDLTKESSGLSQVMVGLGWDEVQQKKGIFKLFGSKPQDIDCDAFAILLGQDGKVVNNATKLSECCIYFNNLRHWSNSIVHQGDNLTGAGEGDDEQIFVDLQYVPYDVVAIVFAVNIYDAFNRNQHFGMLENAFIRVVDYRRQIELCKFNLNENYNNKTALIAGALVRNANGWDFVTDGASFSLQSISDVVSLFC